MFPSVFGQNSGEVILLNEKHKRKLRRFAAVCAVTAFAVLAIFSALYFARVKDYRCASRYSYERSFEETAAAVGALSDTLEKSRYATGQLCHALASEAFAEACAAKAALATLPFSTVEMEQTKSFLGTVGDFTHALCSRDGEFTDDERADVLALSDAASAYSALLLDMKDALSCGELTMDSREKQLVNVLPDPDERHLSDGFADAEENFPTLRELKSVSGVATAPQPQYLDPARARAAAATFLNVSEDLLREEYSYADGTIAFSRGTVTLRADEEHVISLSDSRLVDMVNVSDKRASDKARELLKAAGYENMTESGRRKSGNVLYVSFVGKEGDALCLDCGAEVGIALDNCALYYFRAPEGGPDGDLTWPLSAEDARAALPDSLEALGVKKVISGGEPCYRFRCRDGERSVTVLVDAVYARMRSVEVTRET